MKTWLITGASSGLGKSLANAALNSGDKVLLGARNLDALDAFRSLFPDRAVSLKLDVTKPDDVRSACEIAKREGVEVLVNNAGYGLVAALEETTDEQLERNLRTNLVGPLQLCRGIIPILRERGKGHIINISAIAAFSNELGFAIYGATKAGLEAASMSLAGELAPFGIKVTVVVPGPFRTDFISRSLDLSPRTKGYEGTVGQFEGLLRKIDGRQMGDPNKAAQAIYSIAGNADAPFRLILGKYAYDKFAKKLQALKDEMEGWRSVGLPTDF